MRRESKNLSALVLMQLRLIEWPLPAALAAAVEGNIARLRHSAWRGGEEAYVVGSRHASAQLQMAYSHANDGSTGFTISRKGKTQALEPVSRDEVCPRAALGYSIKRLCGESLGNVLQRHT